MKALFFSTLLFVAALQGSMITLCPSAVSYKDMASHVMERIGGFHDIEETLPVTREPLIINYLRYCDRFVRDRDLYHTEPLMQRLPQKGVGQAPTVQSIQRELLLFNWVNDWHFGKISQSESFDSFTCQNEDLALSKSLFSNQFATPYPKKGFGTSAVVKQDIAYVKLGVADGKACKMRVGQPTPFTYHEFFQAAEFGIKASDNTLGYVTVWHRNVGRKPDHEHSRGGVCHLETYIGKNMVPFLRASYERGMLNDVSRSLSAGYGYKAPFLRDGDLVSFAIVVMQPKLDKVDKENGEEARWNRAAVEAFYRCKLGAHCLIPHVRYNRHLERSGSHGHELEFGLKWTCKI